MNQPISIAVDSATAEQVSALCDGQLDDRALDALLARSQASDESLDHWQRYQLIGDVLRGQGAALPARAPRDFLATLNQRLDAERRPVVAATSVPAPSVRGAAANDAVFRWKLVSGLASVVAVAAVGWTVLATAPGAVTGPVIAQEAVTAPKALLAATPSVAPTAQRPVLVSTPQGKVLRDPALERLLAEHRQHGNMSAFQASTGFIRSATYDDDAR